MNLNVLKKIPRKDSSNKSILYKTSTSILKRFNQISRLSKVYKCLHTLQKDYQHIISCKTK